MLFYNTDIPTSLIDAAFSGSLVVFAGAGVSMQEPMKLPSFDKLVELIKEDIDPASRLRKRAFVESKDGGVIYKESPEHYLSFLENRNRNIRASCAELVASKGLTSELHSGLIRLFGKERPIRIVTTNFDDCFEIALAKAGRECSVFNSPALPLGNDVAGLVHLHGSTDNPDSMVLTAEDYGKAYVTIGWSSRFLVDLFKTYSVLFIGYSCGDSLVDYLTRSISSEMKGNAFALCRTPDETDNWRMRGVTPVLFHDFGNLSHLICDWATYLEQSITDRVDEIIKLSSIEELDSGQCDYLIHSLQWHDESDRALLSKEFCNRSSCFTHLAILFEKGLTGFLVRNDISEADRILLEWVIAQFSIDHCEELQTLCSGFKNELSVHFYDSLVWNLVRVDAPSSAIGAWIAWLESAPYRYLVSCSHPLAHIAGCCDNPDVVLAILRMLTRVNMTFSNDVFSGLRQEAVIPAVESYYEELLLKGLKRHKVAIGERVFDHLGVSILNYLAISVLLSDKCVD